MTNFMRNTLPCPQKYSFSAICTTRALFCSVGSTFPKLELVGSALGAPNRTWLNTLYVSKRYWSRMLSWNTNDFEMMASRLLTRLARTWDQRVGMERTYVPKFWYTPFLMVSLAAGT